MSRKLLLSLLLLSVLAATALAGNTDWSIYASYHNPTKCVAMGSRIYVLANGDLYSYDTQDQSIETYDKATVLSDFGIHDIQLSDKTDELVIIYSNGNIDLLATDGTVYNISELKAKTLPDKTINSVLTDGNTLYISTNSGLAELDLDRRIYKNLYDFGYKVKGICLDDGYILTATSGGVYRGQLSDNLLDPANWEKIGSATGFNRILNVDGQLYALSNILYKITSVSPFRISQVSDDRIASGFLFDKLYYFNTSAGTLKTLDADGTVSTVSYHTTARPVLDVGHVH